MCDGGGVDIKHCAYTCLPVSCEYCGVPDAVIVEQIGKFFLPS